MSARTTRTTGGQISMTASSALTSSICTDDPLSSLVTAPTPTLVIRLGDRSGVPFVLVPGARPAQPRPQEPAQAQLEERPEVLLDQPQEPAPPALEESSDNLAGQPREPAPTELEENSEALVDDPQEPAPAEPENEPAPNSRPIELIIDSLPNHRLSEPIHATVNSLGDAIFTASMRDLDIAATGHSIAEALLLLKEHIDSTFDDLNHRLPRLTSEQKTTLQILQTYIAAPSARSKWF
jgi:hypothetical protein